APRRANDAFFLRAESFYTFSSFIDDVGNRDRMGGHELHALSHGQSFSALIENRFQGNGLYILDEPEAALSPNRQLAFLSRLHELIRQGSQFISRRTRPSSSPTRMRRSTSSPTAASLEAPTKISNTFK
ncbi:MAG TPA: AAA family ATPase, partial [Vitreimonas sp.]|nr:AAA family ATPase [Vitreimonas sp.]